MRDLQQAADDIGTIAETVETLNGLLEKFYNDHPEDIVGEVEAKWPNAFDFAERRNLFKALYSLENKWIPPDHERE